MPTATRYVLLVSAYVLCVPYLFFSNGLLTLPREDRDLRAPFRHKQGQASNAPTSMLHTRPPLPSPSVELRRVSESWGSFFAHLQHHNQVQTPVVIVDPRNGLGNRLRAIASAMAVAAYLRRPLVVAWESDSHCSCSLRMLFEEPFPFILLEDRPLASDGTPRAPAAVLDRAAFRVYNYMRFEEGGAKGEAIDDRDARHIYFRSAFQMNHVAAGTWTTAAWYLTHALLPTPSIAKQVITARWMTGVHIRTIADVSVSNSNGSTDNNGSLQGEAEYGRSGALAFAAARSKGWFAQTPTSCAQDDLTSLRPTSSHFVPLRLPSPPFVSPSSPFVSLASSSSISLCLSLCACRWANFVPKMRDELAARHTIFYVAADVPSAYEGLRRALPTGTVIRTPRSCQRDLVAPGKFSSAPRCDHRDCIGVSAALVDMLNLARVGLILGSDWSSFSEAAAWMGAEHTPNTDPALSPYSLDVLSSPVPILVSGRDFDSGSA